MKSVFRLAGLALIANLAATAAPAAPLAAVARLDSREYKLLLKTARFEHRHRGVKELWKLVKEIARNEKVAVADDSNGLECDQTRHLVFLDSKSFDLYHRGFIVRRRQDDKIDRDRKSAFDLTLKFRSPKAKLALGQNVDPGSSYEGKTKFEEDVIGTGSSTRSVFSHSGTAEIEESWMQHFGDYAQVFPSLSSLPVASQTKMVAVNDTMVKEKLFSLGEFDFGKGPKGAVSVAVWYLRGEESPLVVEFSFKCSFKKPGDDQVERSRRFFEALQRRMKEWIAVGQTKTGLVYKQNSPDSE